MTVRNRELLAALLDVFAERGCFGTSLDTVAATAGIGKASLYRQFESREALCRAALDHGAGELAAHCRQIWEAKPGAPLTARLLAVVSELVALNNRADPQSPNALLRLSCSNRWTVGGQPPEAVTSAFVPLARAWQSAGICDSAEDPRWIAAVLLGLVSSLPLTMPAAACEPPDALARRVTTVLQRAFARESRSD